MKISNLIELNATLKKKAGTGNLATYFVTSNNPDVTFDKYINNQGLVTNNYTDGHDIVAVLFHTNLNDTHMMQIVVAGKPTHRGVMMVKIGGLPFHHLGPARYYEPNSELLGNAVGVSVFNLSAMEFITLEEGEISLELYYDPDKAVVYSEPVKQPEPKG
jgi:hypothetical protein